jgi:hypothetical protein
MKVIRYNEGFTERYENSNNATFHKSVEEKAHKAVKSGAISHIACYNLSTLVSHASYMYNLYNEVESNFCSNDKKGMYTKLIDAYVESLGDSGVDISSNFSQEIEQYLDKRYPNKYFVE